MQVEPLLPDEWQGDHPLFLLLGTRHGTQVIDLDEKGWLTTHAHLMREPGVWHLMRKSEGPQLDVAFSMVVLEGEQPYYVARHVGISGATQREVVCYGIGKKCLDGHTERIWLLPNDQVVLGDQVEAFAKAIIRNG